jgi:hypothetical protein
MALDDPAPQNLAYPATLFLAPIGTDMPAVDDDPADFPAGWEVLGTDGDKDYDESGVVMSQTEEVFNLKGSGSTTTKKRFRTGESNLVKLNLIDVDPDSWAKVLNDQQVETIAPTMGVAGEKRFSLHRGAKVAAFATLIRYVSPVDNDLNGQIEIPKAFVSVNGDSTFNKGVATMLPVEIEPIVITSADEPFNSVQTHEAS